MNNKKTKLTKTEIQANLKQAIQRSSSQVKKRAEQTRRLALRFSPTAWAKLLYFRDKSDSEIGGFGITCPDDLLCVTEFITVKQQVTAISVKFDDEAVADFFDVWDFGTKWYSGNTEYSFGRCCNQHVLDAAPDRSKRI